MAIGSAAGSAWAAGGEQLVILQPELQTKISVQHGNKLVRERCLRCSARCQIACRSCPKRREPTPIWPALDVEDDETE